MLKKILIYMLAIILVLLVALFTIPYFFKGQIKTKVEQALNENIDAKMSFEDADLNLFKNFPNANVTIKKLVIINKAPFEGDTLVSLGELNLKMSVKELFKDANETMNIAEIYSNNGLVNILFNKDGIANYDIALKDNEDKKNEKSKPFSFKIQSYAVANFKFKFSDEKSKIKMTIDRLNHQGMGNFASENLDLETKSTANIVFVMDTIHYIDNVSLSLDAVLGIDLKNSKYTFKKNKALINKLPIELDGFIQMLDSGQQFDLKFKTPSSSFLNFLGLIPQAYASSIENVKTTGDFTVDGFAKGLYSNTSVPKFNIKIASNNASFHYPSLPKSVRNISIDMKIINETELLKDTYVNLDKLSFAIDKDVFNAKAKIKNITQNAQVDALLNGTINLGNLSKAYPVKLSMPLSGILKANLETQFDMQSVEKSQYQNIKNVGKMSLSDFNFADENGKVMAIKTAQIEFNPSQIRLKQFQAKTGKSDINLTGTLDNFYGFLFKNQELKGNFNLISNQLAVNDFMSSGEATAAESKKSQAMKIPSFLNCTLTAKAITVLYDNLILKNVSGKLMIKEEKVVLQNVKTSIFDGTIGANGQVSTKDKIPTFTMDLNLNQVDIAQSFTQLDMLKKIAPIAGIINGKLNSTLKVNGSLDAVELTPNLNSISGNLLGQLLSTTVNSKNSSLLNGISSSLKFIDLSKVNLNDIKAALSFKDGKVVVKPLDVKYKDIKATIGGSHGFDQNMNYTLKFDLPAKYLGNDANAFLSKLTPDDISKLENIPVNALLTGNFSQPKITTDIKSAVSNLTTQLVKNQKQKLAAKGKESLNSVINNALKSKGDSTKTSVKEDVKAKAGELIKGLFGKRKKTE